MSAIGPLRISRLSLSIGLTGSWRAEAWCDQGTAPTGAQPLTVADLTLRGTALRSGSDAPDAPHVVHVGAPGWDRPIAAGTSTIGGVTVTASTSSLAYQCDAGVMLRTVLGDLAKRAGEPVELPADVPLGDHWTVIGSRPGEPLYLRDALNALAAGRYVPGWRADFDGVTRLAPRSGSTVPAGVNVLRRDYGAGLAVIGGDTFASLLPGNVFEGATITRLVITERPGNLQCEVYSQAPSLFTSIRRKVAEWFPSLVYGYPRTYRVGAVSVPDGRLDLDAPADAAHLPPLRSVEVWGLGGARVLPKIGSLAVVMFRDANPARPFVIALEPQSRSLPDDVRIDGDIVSLGAGNGVVVCYGDKVAVDPISGIINQGGAGHGLPPAYSKVKA